MTPSTAAPPHRPSLSSAPASSPKIAKAKPLIPQSNIQLNAQKNKLAGCGMSIEYFLFFCLLVDCADQGGNRTYIPFLKETKLGTR